MPKLILHAGLHKTGTTAIQTFAALNRAALKKQGLLYPDYKPVLIKKYEAHHDLAHTIAGQSKRLGLEQTKQLVKRWAHIAQDSNLKVLLSSEAISRHVDSETSGTWRDKRKTYLKNLAAMLSDFDIMVIVVLRRQDDYTKSLFQEHVMKNSQSGRLQFTAFLKNFEKNQIQRRFYENLLLLEETFPCVQVLIYEDLIKEGRLCAGFFANLEIDTRKMAQVGIVRKSMSPQETILKIFLNQAIVSKKQNKEVLKWIRSPDIQDMLNKYYNNSTLDLWESPQARKEFLSRFDKENEQIRKRYFPQRQRSLFPPLNENTDSRIPPLPEALKAELALKRLLGDSDRKFQNKYTNKFFQCLSRWLSKPVKK